MLWKSSWSEIFITKILQNFVKISKDFTNIIEVARPKHGMAPNCTSSHQRSHKCCLVLTLRNRYSNRIYFQKISLSTVKKFHLSFPLKIIQFYRQNWKMFT